MVKTSKFLQKNKYNIEYNTEYNIEYNNEQKEEKEQILKGKCHINLEC